MTASENDGMALALRAQETPQESPHERRGTDRSRGWFTASGDIVSSSEDDGVYGLTSWRLGAIKERNLALEGYCQTEGCGRFYVFDVDGLISSMGSDYVVPETLPGIVCKACGGALKFKLAMVPPEEWMASEE